MLKDMAVWPTLPIVDVERAKKFYGETLGLPLIKEDKEMGVLFYRAGRNTVLDLYKRGETKADNTAATFEVANIVEEVNVLKGKGVTFEEFSMGENKMENSIMIVGSEKAAWFKDSEGNTLCLHEDLGGGPSLCAVPEESTP